MGEFDSRKNRRKEEMFHQRLFASGSNVPLRFQLPLIFLPRVTKERRGKKGRYKGCTRKKSFSSIVATAYQSPPPL